MIELRKLDPGRTQTHISHKLCEHLNHPDLWVHSFPFTALDTQELTVASSHSRHTGCGKCPLYDVLDFPNVIIIRIIYRLL